jgi:lysozyme family protein
MFDLVVNLGSSKAHFFVQRALRAVGERVKEDGTLGEITLAAVNSVATGELLSAVRSEAVGSYRNIVTKNSSQNRFINSWLKRIYIYRGLKSS